MMFSTDISCTMITPENTMVELIYEFVEKDMDFEMGGGEVYEIHLDGKPEDFYN